jgi:hypothetical protein
MSALCQLRTHALRILSLFDHLVGSNLQWLWYENAERFRSLEVEVHLIVSGRPGIAAQINAGL